MYYNPQTYLLRYVRTHECSIITEAKIETRFTQTPIQAATTQPQGNMHLGVK